MPISGVSLFNNYFQTTAQNVINILYIKENTTPRAHGD